MLFPWLDDSLFQRKIPSNFPPEILVIKCYSLWNESSCIWYSFTVISFNIYIFFWFGILSKDCLGSSKPCKDFFLPKKLWINKKSKFFIDVSEVLLHGPPKPLTVPFILRVALTSTFWNVLHYFNSWSNGSYKSALLVSCRICLF